MHHGKLFPQLTHPTRSKSENNPRKSHQTQNIQQTKHSTSEYACHIFRKKNNTQLYMKKATKKIQQTHDTGPAKSVRAFYSCSSHPYTWNTALCAKALFFQRQFCKAKKAPTLAMIETDYSLFYGTCFAAFFQSRKREWIWSYANVAVLQSYWMDV